MNRKKTIKQLMAIGVQRNDAAAFARAYRKIMDAKREDLFPEIVKPVMPVMGTVVNYRVTPFRADCVISDPQRSFFIENSEECADRIMRELSKDLAKCLMENGAITVRTQQFRDKGTRYTAVVKVVMPGDEYAKMYYA